MQKRESRRRVVIACGGGVGAQNLLTDTRGQIFQEGSARWWLNVKFWAQEDGVLVTLGQASLTRRVGDESESRARQPHTPIFLKKKDNEPTTGIPDTVMVHPLPTETALFKPHYFVIYWPPGGECCSCCCNMPRKTFFVGSKSTGPLQHRAEPSLTDAEKL